MFKHEKEVFTKMTRRMLITAFRRIAIVKQAIKQNSCSGKLYMYLAPKSQRKLEKLGIQTKQEQTIRAAITIYNNRLFVIFQIEKYSGGSVWTIWESLENSHPIWKGHIDNEWI